MVDGIPYDLQLERVVSISDRKIPKNKSDKITSKIFTAMIFTCSIPPRKIIHEQIFNMYKYVQEQTSDMHHYIYSYWTFGPRRAYDSHAISPSRENVPKLN